MAVQKPHTAQNIASIIHDKYYEVTDMNDVLWRGDLIILSDQEDEDCKYFLLVPSEYDGDVFNVVHFVGYHAGTTYTTIPSAASSDKAKNVRLSWLTDNWKNCFSYAALEDARFMKYGDPQDAGAWEEITP